MSATTALGAAPPLAAAVEVKEEEQKVTEETKEAAAEAVDADDTTDVSDDDTVVAAEPVAPQSGEEVRSDAELGNEREARQLAAQRVRQAAGLPPGLRERLAAVVESGGRVGGAGEALVSIDEAIRAVAESLPSALGMGGGDVRQPEHPGGESFFSGRGEHEISEQQAEEIARGQLARSGLLRGQRVRVAQD